jgi:GTPase KRas
VIDGEEVLIYILDSTAGQDEYTMREHYHRTGGGFMLVYNVTSHSSFENISTLRRDILRVKDRDTLPMVVVGNNSDCQREREVSLKGTNPGTITLADRRRASISEVLWNEILPGFGKR